MAQHFKDITELNQTAQDENCRVRWSFLEECLRLEVAQKFQQLMRAVGITQKELAHRSETTQPMLSRFFRGEDSRSPTLETLVKIADALNARVEIRVVEQLPMTNVYWEERSTTPPTAPTEWAGPSVAVETRVAQVAPAVRRWSFHRGSADAICEPVLAH